MSVNITVSRARSTSTARGGDAPVSLDAVDFVRILSGRGDGDGVLRHKLPL